MPNSQSTFDNKMRAWTSAEPFTAPAPEQLVEMLRAALDSANQEYSSSCGGVLPGGDDALPEAHSPLSAPASPSAAVSNAEWAISPPSQWFERPLGLREQVGTALLDQALSKLFDESDKVSLPISTLESPNLWDSPFAIAFLSVGFRRLRCSIQGVVEILDSLLQTRRLVSGRSGGHTRQNWSTST